VGHVTVEKALIALDVVISAVLILAFGVDLITGWPFDRCSLSMDITYLISGVVLAYLTWRAYREQR
jgi:Kef-type K+ transport system membrane component KefB